MSRATTITGKMLEGLAQSYRIDSGKRVAHWIALLGSTFWNMIVVAVPGSLWNIFFRHWLALIYLFDVALIVGGIFVNPRIKIFRLASTRTHCRGPSHYFRTGLLPLGQARRVAHSPHSARAWLDRIDRLRRNFAGEPMRAFAPTGRDYPGRSRERSDPRIGCLDRMAKVAKTENAIRRSGY